jgi:iron complex outermembrane receptor protein
VGIDVTLGYSGPFEYTYYGYTTSSTPYRKKLDTRGAYLEHKWKITPRLTVTPGLRYESVKTWHNNYNFTKDQYYVDSIGEKFIKREFDELVPKSFLTYELDDVSDVLRDTSLSLGVSKIWNATSFCNGCAKTSGAYINPEHGIAYDLILSRRLWRDINLKVDYSYYEIKDYVVWVYSKHRNSTKYASYFTYVPAGATGQGGSCRYNLNKMTLQGVEISLDGHLLDNLSFYLNYAFLEMRDKEGVPWGEEATDERAKHRVNAGLRYKIFDKTLLMLDYKFQDEQTARNSELIDEDEEDEEDEDEWIVKTVPMSAYHVFDVAVEQTCFKKVSFLENVNLKFYINNLFDEEYENDSGYPMTDRTYGAALSFTF